MRVSRVIYLDTSYLIEREEAMNQAVIVIFLALVFSASAFQALGAGSRMVGQARVGSRGDMDMLFGAAKKKAQAKSKSVTIKVDGKEITSEVAPFNLRKALQEKNVNVYPFKAKLTGNCGGAGICGTCAVKVIKGGSNISKQSKNEQNTLAGKPADWRLSCCSKVSGPIECKTKVW